MTKSTSFFSVLGQHFYCLFSTGMGKNQYPFDSKKNFPAWGQAGLPVG
jgi:hypothetical protein